MLLKYLILIRGKNRKMYDTAVSLTLYLLEIHWMTHFLAHRHLLQRWAETIFRICLVTDTVFIYSYSSNIYCYLSLETGYGKSGTICFMYKYPFAVACSFVLWGISYSFVNCFPAHTSFEERKSICFQWYPFPSNTSNIENTYWRGGET